MAGGVESKALFRARSSLSITPSRHHRTFFVRVFPHKNPRLNKKIKREWNRRLPDTLPQSKVIEPVCQDIHVTIQTYYYAH